MTFTIKDVLYIVGWFASIIGIFSAFRYELYNLKNQQKKEHSIIWQDGGRLNIVDHKACREYRNMIWQNMRKSDNAIDGITARLGIHERKIIRILVKLELNGKVKKE
jgi:predicted Rossmann fold nucleotide-binding protein DprA/Smf involved in DNA uptake